MINWIPEQARGWQFEIPNKRTFSNQSFSPEMQESRKLWHIRPNDYQTVILNLRIYGRNERNEFRIARKLSDLQQSCKSETFRALSKSKTISGSFQRFTHTFTADKMLKRVQHNKRRSYSSPNSQIQHSNKNVVFIPKSTNSWWQKILKLGFLIKVF